MFCGQFSAILKSGISLGQGLNLLAMQSRNTSFKRALMNACHLVQQGNALSSALAKQGNKFPIILISAIEAGEASGTLDISLEKMSKYFERRYETQQTIRKAMVYPIVLTLSSIVILFFLINKVIPEFLVFFGGADLELPRPTKIVIGFSTFVSTNRLKILFSILILIITIKALKSYKKFKWLIDMISLKLPILNKYVSKVVISRLNSTAAVLISTGVSITEALTISSRSTNNAYMDASIKKVTSKIQNGQGFADALKATDLLSPDIIAIIAIGEESGRIEEVMQKVADLSEIEAEGNIEVLVSLVEPGLILILGGLIAFIIMSIALPMLEIYGHMN